MHYKEGMRVLVLTDDDFFFSSRRRHTRFDCDWSSDVCSSDLHADGPCQVSLLRPFLHVSRDVLLPLGLPVARETSFEHEKRQHDPDGFPAIYSLDRKSVV